MSEKPNLRAVSVGESLEQTPPEELRVDLAGIPDYNPDLSRRDHINPHIESDGSSNRTARLVAAALFCAATAVVATTILRRHRVSENTD